MCGFIYVFSGSDYSALSSDQVFPETNRIFWNIAGWVRDAICDKPRQPLGLINGCSKEMINRAQTKWRQQSSLLSQSILIYYMQPSSPWQIYYLAKHFLLVNISYRIYIIWTISTSTSDESAGTVKSFSWWTNLKL